MVHWFDIVSEESEVYSCPQLYYTEDFNIVPIGSINQEVYIVQRFDKKNYFLLNKFMF